MLSRDGLRTPRSTALMNVRSSPEAKASPSWEIPFARHVAHDLAKPLHALTGPPITLPSRSSHAGDHQASQIL
jgi:hypothetical protein